MQSLRAMAVAAICALTVTNWALSQATSAPGIPAKPATAPTAKTTGSAGTDAQTSSQIAPQTPFETASQTGALRFIDMKNVTNAGDMDAQKAAHVLDRMVTAMGGERWMDLRDVETEGRSASFYHGNPSGGYTLYFTFHKFPEEDRSELTKKRNILQIVDGKDAWEVTFQGKHRMDKESADDFFRRRSHSIEQLLRVWLRRPGNAMFYGGRKMADSHLADEVTVLTEDNDAITVQVDIDTHLPRKRSFDWRDPVYKDKNTDDETYDDWHLAQGLPSSFLITRYRNGEMNRQQYLSKVGYNLDLSDTFFDPDVAAATIVK